MSLLSMPMVDYNPDDTCAELVLLQGISAQLTRIKRRHRSLCAFPTTATATETTTSNTPKSQSLMFENTTNLPWSSKPPTPTSDVFAMPNRERSLTQSPSLSSSASSSPPPSSSPSSSLSSKRPYSRPPIPIKLLLPANRRRVTISHKHSTAGGMLATPPDSPMCASKRTSSINPRFSDAHFEYIGDDCVIHNGMQTIDIALEFATQRAAPRLVNFSKSPSTAQQLPITP